MLRTLSCVRGLHRIHADSNFPGKLKAEGENGVYEFYFFPFFLLFVHLFLWLFILFVCLSYCSSVYSIIYLFIHLFIGLSYLPIFIYLFISFLYMFLYVDFIIYFERFNWKTKFNSDKVVFFFIFFIINISGNFGDNKTTMMITKLVSLLLST